MAAAKPNKRSSRLSADRQPSVALLLAGLLALVIWGASEWSYQRASAALDRVGERRAATQALHLVVRHLLDAESAQRGYLITARREYLVPLDGVRADLERALQLLAKHYAGDANANAVARQLRERSADKLSELAETLALHDAGQHQRWHELILTNIGREKLSEARLAVEQLLNLESARLVDDRADIYRTLEFSRVAVHASTLLALVGLVFFLRRTASMHAAERAHAMALQNERDNLERQVRERTLDLSELNRHLQDLREAERSQLARSLHDNMGALLTAAKLDLARLRHAVGQGASAAELDSRINHLAEALDEGIRFKRALTTALSPAALHNLGLRAALEILVSDLHRESGVEVSLDVPEIGLAQVPRIVAFRLIEAALANVAQHARVKAAQVLVREQDDQLVVQVRDSGVGFVADPAPPVRGALVNLRYRIETTGGHLRITSAPGKGTEIEARIPLQTSEGGEGLRAEVGAAHQTPGPAEGGPPRSGGST